MSGIVGIINLDGAPVDQQLLRQMTDFMAFRGPDAQDIWIDGYVGFGHTLLCTTPESLRERQPCSLDGQVWITADARVDGRRELVQDLEAKGRSDLDTATDVDLILHAYHVWGEDCVQHLLGDFAFAIWDGHRQSLFCARDHFGLKPFYFAQVKNCLVFSNTLDSVRLHPAVSDELNDLVISDFLIFGHNQEFAATAFADVQRLPGAHVLTWSGGTPRLNRYWTLPLDGRVRYKRARDYVEHFRELLRTAVADRLRTNQVGVLMSGGTDSTTVAATAREVLSERPVPFDLRAYSVVYDRLIPDQERYYSGLAAAALGIPVHYLAVDDYPLYDRWDQPEFRTPEPVNNPLAAIGTDHLRHIAARNRIALTGLGGDPLFYASPAYFADLLKRFQFRRVVADIGWCLWSRRIPPLGIRSTLKRWLGKRPSPLPYPTWVNKAFAARVDLPARWKQLSDKPQVPVHPLRPHAYEELTNLGWQKIFEYLDPSVTCFWVEVRHPFFDVRLVNYLLAIPSVPWCMHKELLRAAMRGTLPEPVRLRAKAPLAGDPVSELLESHDSQWVDRFDPTPELGKYVDRDAVPQLAGEQDSAKANLNLRPLSLNCWLLSARRHPSLLLSSRLGNRPNRTQKAEKRC